MKLNTMKLNAILEVWRATGVPANVGIRAAVEAVRDVTPALCPDEKSMAEVIAGTIAKQVQIPLRDAPRQEAVLELGRQLASLLFDTFRADRPAFMRVLQRELYEILVVHERAWQQERRAGQG